MGRGRSGVGVGGGGIGGTFATTPVAGGGVVITPSVVQPGQNAPQGAQATGGISDTNTHTTYFTPADMAIVSGAIVSNGYRMSPRTGTMQVVGYYNTGDYYNINTELRDLANGRRTKLTPQTQAVVDAMDRNMRPLNNDMDTVRWTDMTALRSNLGMSSNASTSDVIRRLQGGDIVGKKSDYTSSCWDRSKSSVAGEGGRNVLINMHYKKGAMVQFSPTRKEHEVVGARNIDQRFSNARVQRMQVKSTRGTPTKYMDVLVVDCYVDN